MVKEKSDEVKLSSFQCMIIKSKDSRIKRVGSEIVAAFGVAGLSLSAAFGVFAITGYTFFNGTSYRLSNVAGLLAFFSFLAIVKAGLYIIREKNIKA